MKKFYFSRKTHLLATLIFLLLFGILSVPAQQIITEHISKNVKGNIQYKPNFDQHNYKKNSDKNGTTSFLKNPDSVPQIKLASKSNAALNINFNYDESEYYISSFLIFSESGYSYAADYSTLSNPLILNIPNGTYEVITTFNPINPGQTHIVIKEQQNIQGNISIAVNMSEAINHFSTTVYNENGDLFPDDVNGYFYFQRMLYYNPTDFLATSDYYFTGPVAGQEPESNFYINNVSNRYAFIQTLDGGGFPKGTYAAKFKTVRGINGAVSLSNNPADWSYLTQTFQRTKVSNDYGPSKFSASTYKGNLLTGWTTSSGGTINPGDDPFKGYVSNRVDGDLADFIVIPAIIDAYVSYSPTTGGVIYYMKGNPIYSDGNGGILYGSGDVSFNSHGNPNYAVLPFLSDDYYVQADHQTKLFPIHPKFSFDKSTSPNVILGNNVPITVTGFENGKLKIADKGRYGETRETDYLATQIELKQNGNSIFSGYLEDFTSSLPSTGQIEIILTNPNILIEGLEGKNTTTISYNGSDLPPTLQHLQFRNLNDQVTDIFDSTQSATVRLAAGDFKYNSNGTDGYFTYEAGNTVTLFYSKHSENNWATLGITKYPEYFQMPAFGDYYEGSLVGIQKESQDAWFDIKTICTDPNGNKQEQIISPAFKVNRTLAVENSTQSSFNIYPNPFSNRLNIKIDDYLKGKYTVKVIDITGKTVYSTIENEKSFIINGSFLPKGVYILSIENEGKITSRKVMKK